MSTARGLAGWAGGCWERVRPPPRHGRARGGVSTRAEAPPEPRSAAAVPLPPSRCRHDHPRSLLYLRQDRRQQVGGLPGAAAGRVHRGVRRPVRRGGGGSSAVGKRPWAALRDGGKRRRGGGLGLPGGAGGATRIRFQVTLEGLSVPGSPSALLSGEPCPPQCEERRGVGMRPLALGASGCPSGRPRCLSTAVTP